MSTNENEATKQSQSGSEEKNENPSLPRSMRANRGSKMMYLVEKEDLIDEDDEFWGKDGKLTEMFKEETNDTEFVEGSSEESEDSSDSDIDDPENEIDEAKETDEDVKELPKKKRKNVYVDPLRKKTKSLQRTKKLVEVSVNENEKMPLEERTTEPKEKLEEIPNESESQTSDQTQPRKKRKTSSITTENKVIEQRQLRPSTIQYSEERRMLRELEREVLEERRAKRRKRKQKIRKLTQEDLLKEAKITEELNKQSLAVMLKIEEEKKRLPPSKPKIIGPKIVYRSTQKEETVTFTDVDELPPFLNCKPIPYPNRNVCEITGLTAKYLDPKTKIPFATLEAFKHIRNRDKSREQELQTMKSLEREFTERSLPNGSNENNSTKQSCCTPPLQSQDASDNTDLLENLPFVQKVNHTQNSIDNVQYIVNL